MKKGLIIILDGLGDRPCPELENRTALEAADTPFMDKLLSRGSCGLVDPLYPGIPVDTHTGCGALMGIAPQDVKRLARGTVEAAGIGLDMQPGDIVLRTNFATLEDDGSKIIDRRAERISDEVPELCQALQNLEVFDGVTASMYPASQHRAVLHLQGPNLSSEITDTDPGCNSAGCRVLISKALDPANEHAVNTATALNEFSQRAHEILQQHPLNLQRIANDKLPANGLLCRGAGMAFSVRNLISHLGLKTAVITGERTLCGIGNLSTFKVIHQDGFTGMSDTDLNGKFQAARQALEDHDLAYVHIKAPDIFSHDKDARGKMEFLQQIDKAISIVADSDYVIGISADHSTDSNTGRHCGDPVPVLLSSNGGRIDNVTTFGETNCMQGGLGRITGNGFLLSVLDAMGALPNYHPFDSVFIGGN